MKSVRRAILLAACFSLAACSGGGSNSRIDYKEAKTLPSLDVPPGLGQPLDNSTDNVPELAETAAGTGGSDSRQVLPEATGIHIARDGSTRWLEIDSSADKLWPKLRQFWPSIGLELKLDKPAEGIMETQWAENRADLPQGYFARMVRKVIKTAYSADTRDKYRLRLEPVDASHTELFITHYGLKQVAPKNVSGEVIDTVWVVRPSDPELANEVLNRLVLYLGGSKQTAKAALGAKAAEETSRSHIDGDTVVLDEGFSRAWRLTGLALDRIGWVVEDRNRSEGIYYVSHIDLLKDTDTDQKKGWLSSLFSSDSESEKTEPAQKQWQIRLNGDDNTTRISVYDAKGTALSEKESMPILKRLQESLR
jgi:outer membrane protein assembly factor BamC